MLKPKAWTGISGLYRSARTIVRAEVTGYFVAALALSLTVLVLIPVRDFLMSAPTHESEHWVEIPEVAFMLLILLVARIWGSKPSLFVSLLSIVALVYYFIAPFNSVRITETRDLLMLIAFAVILLTIGPVSARLKQRTEEAEQAKSEIERMYRELEATFDRASQAEAVRRSEPYIKLAQAIAKAGFFDWEIPSNTVFWSDTFYDVFGMDRSVEPTYENWLRTLHPEDRERMPLVVQEFLGSTKNQHEVDYRALMKDGSIRWMNARWGLVRDPSGAPIRMVGAIIDISERKRHEEAARTSEEFKSALLDCVAHDLRTPLTSIRVAATSLLRHRNSRAAMDETQTELLGVIDEETESLDKYVGSLLDMARIEAARFGLQRSATEVTDVVAEALQHIRPAGALSKVQLRLAPDLPRFEADSRAIAQVVHILVDNACKYGSGTPIVISAHQPNAGEIQLSVSDQGPGIAAELRERVFHKFYRIEEAMNSSTPRPVRTPGSGLGLAIARGIVQGHGGKIWIEDAESGKGTKVVFAFPIRHGDANETSRVQEISVST